MHSRHSADIVGLIQAYEYLQYQYLQFFSDISLIVDCIRFSKKERRHCEPEEKALVAQWIMKGLWVKTVDEQNYPACGAYLVPSASAVSPGGKCQSNNFPISVLRCAFLSMPKLNYLSSCHFWSCLHCDFYWR